MKPFITLPILCALALDAAAQSSPLQPTDPAEPAPGVTYQSAFESYAPWREPKLAPWVDLNAQVHEAGGHGGIFGTGGNAGHGDTAKPPSKPATNHLPPRSESSAPFAQPPVRGAPKAPAPAHGGH
jgi:hypothetical protein